MTSRLEAQGVTLGYDRHIVSTDLHIAIPDGSFTAIIGPNACGKSTLLRAYARVLKPLAGSMVLDGADMATYPAKEVAKRLGLLPQSAIAPDGIRVADLVARGRFPYQGIIRQWTSDDSTAVKAALEATQITDLSGRLVDELSGGQRQRVWIAMLLAQQTNILLLDEPTTFLDISHQFELLELLRRFHRNGHTIITVLHDLNQAARYANHLIVMKEGQVVAEGDPSSIITADLVEDVFHLPCIVMPDPVTASPAVFPLPPKE